jgi:regulator of nonsense transcripts 2
MRSQQQADREEQQRIKNLVLNYEAANEPEVAESKSATSQPEFELFFLLRYIADDETLAFEKRIPANQRVDKSGANRSAFRSRKLQLSDVNW